MTELEIALEALREIERMADTHMRPYHDVHKLPHEKRLVAIHATAYECLDEIQRKRALAL